MSAPLSRLARICLILVTGTATVRADVQLSVVIGQDAVIQRDMPVPIWGISDPGEAVTVTFADQVKSTTAGPLGRWSVELDPMPASTEPRQLVASGSSNRVEVQGVVVGDVWLYVTSAWHLDDRSKYREFEPPLDAAVPLRAYRPTNVHHSKNHRQRPQAEFSARGESRWSTYRAPGRYFPHDAFYLGLGVIEASGVPVGVLGLGAATLESMIPPAGYRAHAEELGELGRTVLTWLPETTTGRDAYLQSLDALEVWSTETRRVFGRENVTFEALHRIPELPGPPKHGVGPMTTYNGVLHRVMPAAVRGLIIEPRTDNVGDTEYLAKATALIDGLRRQMGRPELPVCFIQMHSPDRYERNAAGSDDDWVRLRAAQTELTRLPNTTVLATYDIDPEAREAITMDLALRASQWAVAILGGDSVRSGPSYLAHRFADGGVTIEFEHLGGGLMVGHKEPARPVTPDPEPSLGGFELVGEDGVWHPATARIAGELVLVSSVAAPAPVAVRYAWRRDPGDANLYNREGFPALPFCTDGR